MKLLKHWVVKWTDYNVYKVWNIYYVEMQSQDWTTAWWNDANVRIAASKAKNTLNTQLANVHNTDNRNDSVVPTNSTLTTNIPTWNTVEHTQPVEHTQSTSDNNIEFWSNANEQHKDDWSSYEHTRNSKISDRFLKSFLNNIKTAKANWTLTSAADIQKLRDETLANTVSQYGWQIDWNNPAWKRTVDKIYRQSVLTLRKNGVNDWNALYNWALKNVHNTPENTVDHQATTDYQDKTTSNNTSDIAHKKALLTKIDANANKLDAEWLHGYATSLRLLKWKINWAQDVKTSVLDNYDHYMDSVDTLLKDKSDKYQWDKTVIQKMLDEKFWELDEASKELDKNTDSEYQAEKDRIKWQLSNQQNIAQWLSTKWQWSAAQVYASQKVADDQYDTKLDDAKSKYLREKNNNYWKKATLYSNWLWQQNQIQRVWDKPLYDSTYNEQKTSNAWLQWRYEKYTWAVNAAHDNVIDNAVADNNTIDSTKQAQAVYNAKKSSYNNSTSTPTTPKATTTPKFNVTVADDAFWKKTTP